MIDSVLRYAYIDEAGNVAFSRQNHILVVAALCTDSHNSVGRIIRKAQKKYGSSLASGELKAKWAEDKLVKTVLTFLAREPIEVFAIVVDRRLLENPSKDPEEIYRQAVARLVKTIVAHAPAVEIVLDRRYTKEHLRYLLEKSIRKEISGLRQQYVLIRQEDSTLFKELQAVDFIAWAFFQKFERGQADFYEYIAPRVVAVEVFSKQTWEQAQK